MEDGTPYPAVLLTAGESDSRVDPMHARKMAARLQAATSSGKPVLLREETRAGHGQGKPVSKLLEEWTDVWTLPLRRARPDSWRANISHAPGPPRLLAPPPARPFNEERLLLDRRLETLRRILPEGPTPQVDIAVVRELADQARLARTEILPRPSLEAGPRGTTPVELTAVGRFADVDRFFRQVALHHRLLDVESLVLTATPEDVVKLTP